MLGVGQTAQGLHQSFIEQFVLLCGMNRQRGLAGKDSEEFHVVHAKCFFFDLVNDLDHADHAVVGNQGHGQNGTRLIADFFGDLLSKVGILLDVGNSHRLTGHRDVPDNSTVVGVPGHIIFREGKRIVITDPKQINDPLSEALSAVATQLRKLTERVEKIEGSEADAHAASKLQAIIEIDYQI